MTDSILQFCNIDKSFFGVPVLKDVTKYYVPATYFAEPIMYSEPTEYGSTGIVFFQGICMVCRPLAVGVHTLTNYTWTLIPAGNESIVAETGVVWDNSWTITVVPKGGKAAAAAQAAQVTQPAAQAD